MRDRLRLWLFLPSAALLCAWLCRAVLLLPGFGHKPAWYPALILRAARPERSITDTVTAVTFDYRGFDTLFEEVILFAAAAGALLLLRHLRQREDQLPLDAASEPGGPQTVAARLTLRWLLPVGLVIGAELISHGHLTPGGGFQGGVVLATVVLLVHVLGRYQSLERMFPHPAVEAFEALGVCGFALAGVSSLLVSMPLFTNWPPKGPAGAFVSSGLVFPIDLLVGVAVAGALVALGHAFLEQLLRIREKERE